jgi:hypothetical protein
MALLALSNRAHWAQVRGGPALAHSRVRRLRTFGGGALVVSLSWCLAADHPTMASLVWIMTSSASAVAVALTLAYRPHWLRCLVVWVKA